ncbi:acyltransferase family protein [uncultured Legionella sp.]|uniref:acyltransferase family protein n=1 Tax=uncultured Legionella sp. TaxID=210934 RepID=UPI00261E60DC|nr:acyltransferase family protein [uncultured Legionella sp.]
MSVPPLSHPKYRPDIDGLRAIAVLSVVAFHAFPNLLRGGFIGVDIFFVISGFLISTIIFESLDRGVFSFSEFYSRRVRRIFPALLLVLSVSCVLGWFILFADEYKQLGKHIAGGAGFLSNIVLLQESGYFDNAAETKPLLHLWSLGVEEQFYIIYPFLLWFTWKRKFNLFSITVLVALISFYLNVSGIKNNAIAAFYSPQTRFWELMCGSLLAWMMLYKKEAYPKLKSNSNKWLTIVLYRQPRDFNKQTLANVASFIGLLLLVYGVLRINQRLSYPGKWALVPVLGAVLIIFAGQQAWVNRTILSNRVAVWFGLISYPLYLWHWILLSYARILESEQPSIKIRMMCVGLSIGLAWLTFRYIEQPFRKREKKALKTASLALSMICILFIGVTTSKLNGFPSRLPDNLSQIVYFGEDPPEDHQNCMNRYGLNGFIRYCNLSGTKKPSIALIGDSHATALYQGLSELLEQQGDSLLNIGGRLFLDVATYPAGNDSEIAVYQGGIRATEFVAQETSLSTVIMASRGPFYITDGWIFTLISEPEITDKQRVWEVGMRKTLDRMVLAKKRIIFIIDNPEIDFDPRKCISRPNNPLKKPPDCSIPKNQYDERNKTYRELVLRILKEYPEVTVFDAAAYLCDKEKCWAKINNKVLYSDSNHLSREGARYLSRELIKVINDGVV